MYFNLKALCTSFAPCQRDMMGSICHGKQQLLLHQCNKNNMSPKDEKVNNEEDLDNYTKYSDARANV